MKILDLFSGIGGFSLGLERAGMETAAFCEIDPFCRRVLAKHWPEVPCYDDVQTLSRARLVADGVRPVDIICGGFPCQDISSAAEAPAGLAGERSGLWRDYARLVGELRPSFVVVENVDALRIRGLDRVLGDLAALGYDAEWDGIPASAVGASHPRDRIWIVAYPPEVFGQEQRGDKPRRLLSRDGLLAFIHDQGREDCFADWRAAEPGMDRGLHGVRGRVDRLGSLSNAVVPHIAEYIGRAIIAARMSIAANDPSSPPQERAA